MKLKKRGLLVIYLKMQNIEVLGELFAETKVELGFFKK
jgi:hypothetical protein